MAHRHWGHRLADRREYELAVTDFTRALQLDPGFVDALYDRGLVYWRDLSDGDRAAQDLTRVVELEPQRWEAWFNRAFARQLQGDSDGAIADFAQYLREGSDPMWREICQRQMADLAALAASGREPEET